MRVSSNYLHLHCVCYSLRNKKNGLNKMQEAYLDITETFANKTYENEYILTKRILQEVKNDLVRTAKFIMQTLL